ncbi:MAG: MBL fold metallo-hydrolase [Chloroflexi bacterium]|nr:MBL fold metallo-hydrolase [Chloroflexota bacterium]
MRVRQFVDEGLGNSAHLLISESGGVAALIDPLRDIDQYVAAARAEGVRITHVLETHIHNDFLSGSRELAALTGARIVASADAGLELDHQPVRDGDTLAIGDVQIKVLATPGHTPEHVSYLAQNTAKPTESAVLFSGGSLLVGAVSRTDLLGHEHATGLAHQLYHSLHEKILPLADDVIVHPTHGAGSFCTAAAAAESTTTIGRERRNNPFLALAGPEAFTKRLLESMPSYPSYFDHMRALNRRGPHVLEELPRLARLTPHDVCARQRSGEALVDTRSIHDYARGHIPGVYHVELRPAFASWVGWVVPFGTPVILVSDTTEVHEYAVRQLIRIGYDDLPGYLDGGMDAWKTAGLPIDRVPVLTMHEVRQRLIEEPGEPLVVVDVRQAHEWAAGHMPRAELVEAGALPCAELHLPHDRLLAIHCGHGQRAATGLSVLEHRGYENLALIAEGIDEWRAAGGEVERGTPSGREPAGL